MITNHPFNDEQVNDPGKISFVFMDRVPDDAAVANLRESNPGREEIHARGQALYVFYIDGKGRSRLNNNRIERALNVTATARNWNTTQKLHKLAQDFND